MFHFGVKTGHFSNQAEENHKDPAWSLLQVLIIEPVSQWRFTTFSGSMAGDVF